jgi:hypothetical protein
MSTLPVLYTYIVAMRRLPAVSSLVRQYAIVPRAVVWALLAGLGVAAFAQQYPFLPVADSPKSVKILFQDSRGRLWLGGLEPAVFDGRRFFFLRDYGFPPAEAYDFSEDASGAIWIGAETGVYRFANGITQEIGKGAATSVIAATPDVAFAAMGPLGRDFRTSANLVRFQRTGDR